MRYHVRRWIVGAYLSLIGVGLAHSGLATSVETAIDEVVDVPSHYKVTKRTAQIQEDVKDGYDDEERTSAWTRLIARFGVERRASGLSYSLYNPELSYARNGYVAMRKLCFGPLREHEKSLAYLHRMAANPLDDSFESLYAVLFLADDATPEDLAAILEGYRAFTTEASYRVSFARQLGRATAYVRETVGDDHPVVVEAIAQLETDLENESLWARGAAHEGWYRAGFEDDAERRIAEVLRGGLEPRDKLRVLEPASRILHQPAVDPDLLLEANELAIASAEHVLATAEVDATSLVDRVSHSAKLFQAALGLLEDTATPEHLDFLLRCYTDPRSPVLLGITGLQGQRLNLQRLRRDLDTEQRRRVDRIFFDTLIIAGERLFSLEEDPMDPAERSAFESRRDFRYNAASYIADQWTDNEDLQDAWLAESDAAEFLAILCQSAEDETEGDPGNELYYAVREKMETRVLAGQILAMMQSHLSYQIVEPDLGAFFVTTAASECRAPAQDCLQAFKVLVASKSEHLVAEIPIVRKPDDEWIKTEALIGLTELGYIVFLDSKTITIRLAMPSGM